MKKIYILPEIEYIKIELGTDICSSKNAETPIIDIIEEEEEEILDDII